MFTRRRRPILLALAGVLAAATLLAAGTGAMRIGGGEAIRIIGSSVGLVESDAVSPASRAVLLTIRLPRIVAALLIGATRGVAGAAMQGMFRNPLADPALIGVSAGGALGAVLVIMLGGSLVAGSPGATLPGWIRTVAAFSGSVIVTFVVYRIATKRSRTDVATLILAGIAVNALSGALTGLAIYLADDAQLRDISFWSLGSLGAATWSSVAQVAPFSGALLVMMPFFSRSLNALLLGEREARHLGINVERTKRIVIFVSAAAVGAAVATSGIIGFVGLVAPHLVRLVLGPDHRNLFPATAGLGALLLLLADTLSRTIVAPAELPIGIITASVGGPFFLYLLVRPRPGRL